MEAKCLINQNTQIKIVLRYHPLGRLGLDSETPNNYQLNFQGETSLVEYAHPVNRRLFQFRTRISPLA